MSMSHIRGLLQLVARSVLEQAQNGLCRQGDCANSKEKCPVELCEYDAWLTQRAELEGLEKGKDIFHEDWIDQAFAGTPEDPVVVTSAYTERIVGVPDPDDDCLVIWGVIKADEPPKQLVEDGEYFVLKTLPNETWTGIPESFKGTPHH